MLRFVLGRSGCGKTEYLQSLFAAKAEAGESRLLYMVPDQISFETEAEFLRRLGPSAASNITVLGFSRLTDYVFDQTGHRSLSFADDGVRHVVMSIALEQIADRLELFSSKSGDFDLCDLMLTTVKEYKKCAINSEMLLRAAENAANQTLQKKLRETALVLDTYNAVMEKSYLDPLDSLTRVAALLEEDPVFAGYSVAVDSFYGFTAQEYEVLERLFRKSEDMWVSLCDDFSDENSHLFVSKRTKRRLSDFARAEGIGIAPPVRLTEPRRFASDALAWLEQNVYSYDKTPFDGDAPEATCYRALNIYDECDFVGRNIRKLIESGYRYRDIAVIARTTDAYTGILDNAFERYGISYFMDKPFNIHSMPLIRLVTSAFDVVAKGYDRDDVLNLLKSGLTVYSAEEIALFENYLFTWDLNGSALKREFKANPAGFADDFSEEDRAVLATVERIRSDVIGKLKRFESEKDGDGLTIAKALMKLLYALSCDKNIDALCDVYEAQGDEELAGDLVRIWKVFTEILDKMVFVIGDYRVGMKRFGELLRTYFSNIEIATIPRGIDQVDVALADRALLSKKKAVFVIGALDGEFPRTPVEAGVFTDAERVALKASSLPLSDSVEELSNVERYYAYSALSAASERLYLSFCASSLSGDILYPSNMVTEVLSVLPKLTYSEYDFFGVDEHLYSAKAAFEFLISRYHRSSAQLSALKAYFRKRPDYAPVLNAVDTALLKTGKQISDRELAKKLFKDRMMVSSSQIETYHKCPFEYFCQYGLRVRERKKAAMDALEYGTLMHYILEEFFCRHINDDFEQLDRGAARREVEELLSAYAEKHLGGLEGKNDRFLYLFSRIRIAAAALVGRILDELSQSEFRPSDFELSIGDEIPAFELTLPDGAKVVIRGSVDRVDIAEKNGEKYIRVIDYKTGTKKFRLSDILYGLNLQMFIYLSAIRQNGEKKYGARLTPAGVLYMPAVAPSVSVEAGATDAQIEKKRNEKYSMKGVILSDDEVVAAMEKDKNGVFIPVSVSRSGALKAGAEGALLDLEEFGAVFRKVDELISQMAQELRGGNVDAVPAKGTNLDACQYCRYRAVCGHQDGDRMRNLPSLDADEVVKELLRKEGEDGETLDGEPEESD